MVTSQESRSQLALPRPGGGRSCYQVPRPGAAGASRQAGSKAVKQVLRHALRISQNSEKTRDGVREAGSRCSRQNLPIVYKLTRARQQPDGLGMVDTTCAKKRMTTVSTPGTIHNARVCSENMPARKPLTTD
ncbi:hypothetical protein RRG08_036102 [Elysia crispata]|uniref:Uncharacterized protein n=1 Tax=Elysia crispata TaxID=231223 RepID=A0AAE1E0J5_9GAST|nr:hypothetical protein RRG08_036102 [Elysia crispata]